MRVSPVAARAAAAEGVDLAQVAGSGPAGRIVKADVLGAAGGNGTAAPASAPGSSNGQGSPSTEPMKGGAAALARYMDAVALDPDGDELPHAHRHRPGRPPARAEGGRSARSPSRT